MHLPEGFAGRPCVSNGLIANLYCAKASQGVRIFNETSSNRIVSSGTQSYVVVTHIGYRDEVMVYNRE